MIRGWNDRTTINYKQLLLNIKGWWNQLYQGIRLIIYIYWLLYNCEWWAVLYYDMGKRLGWFHDPEIEGKRASIYRQWVPLQAIRETGT